MPFCSLEVGRLGLPFPGFLQLGCAFDYIPPKDSPHETLMVQIILWNKDYTDLTYTAREALGVSKAALEEDLVNSYQTAQGSSKISSFFWKQHHDVFGHLFNMHHSSLCNTTLVQCTHINSISQLTSVINALPFKLSRRNLTKNTD